MTARYITFILAFVFFALFGASGAKAATRCGTHGNTMRFHCDRPDGGRYWQYNERIWKRALAVKLACTREDRLLYGERCVLGLHWEADETPEGWYVRTVDHDLAPIRLFVPEYLDLPRYVRQNVLYKHEMERIEPEKARKPPKPDTAVGPSDPDIPDLEGSGPPSSYKDPEISDL